jgi:hypothetical protein
LSKVDSIEQLLEYQSNYTVQLAHRHSEGFRKKSSACPVSRRTAFRLLPEILWGSSKGISLSGGRQHFAVACRSGIVAMFDPESREKFARLEFQFPVTAFAPTGDRVAVAIALEDRSTKICGSAAVERRFGGHEPPVAAISHFDGD